MARMRRRPQRVEDPDVEARHRRVGLCRDAAEVAGIGEIADAEAEREDLAMVLPERQDLDVAARPGDGQRLRRRRSGSG